MEYESLLNSVTKDLEEYKERREKNLSVFNGIGCDSYDKKCKNALTDYAENGCDCGKSCEYCRKFKWTIDRAKHYGEKLNIPWKEIIASWEEDRNYWYMNYYQECNQPKIESNNVFVFESVEEMKATIGTEFICPCCHGVSTNPYECNSGIEVAKGKTCDWKSYGLIRSDLAFLYCKQERKGTRCFMPKAFIK